MPAVNLLIKPASGLCNMHCKYCFYCDEAARRKQASYGLMTERTLKNVIRRSVLVASGVCTIAFQGGEPTLCGLDFFQKAVEYAQHYSRGNVELHFALQTNGTLIDEEWCRFLAENDFLVGISVDGTRAIHDSYRQTKEGGPTYDRVLKTIQMFDRFGVEYNILTVVHREVADNIQEIYRAYRKKRWDYLQFITCLDPLGEERGKQEYSLLPETYGQFLIDLFDLWYEDYKQGQQPSIRQFENYESILLGFAPESCEQRGACGIQNVVEADGSVYPCDFYALDAYCLGNLNTDSLQTIYDRREQMGFVERSLNHPQECKECRWFKLCRGGCYRSRLMETELTPAGEPLKAGEGRGTEIGKNYFCVGYRMFFEACFDRLEEVAQDTEELLLTEDPFYD